MVVSGPCSLERTCCKSPFVISTFLCMLDGMVKVMKKKTAGGINTQRGNNLLLIKYAMGRQIILKDRNIVTIFENIAIWSNGCIALSISSQNSFHSELLTNRCITPGFLYQSGRFSKTQHHYSNLF